MAWLRNKKTGGWFEIPNEELDTNKYMNNLIRKSASRGRKYEIPKGTLEKLKGREDGNYYVAEITPDDYLRITSSDELIKTIEQETIKYGELDLSKINNGYMMLEIDLNDGKVVSHEGRHRMQLLKNNGYTKAQIVVMSKSSSYNDEKAHDFAFIDLKHQIEKEKYTTKIKNVKILNKKGGKI